jgi:ABC-type branched-subunit amino acid transport system substrate-binding protein
MNPELTIPLATGLLAQAGILSVIGWHNLPTVIAVDLAAASAYLLAIVLLA